MVFTTLHSHHQRLSSPIHIFLCIGIHSSSIHQLQRNDRPISMWLLGFRVLPSSDYFVKQRSNSPFRTLGSLKCIWLICLRWTAASLRSVSSTIDWPSCFVVIPRAGRSSMPQKQSTSLESRLLSEHLSGLDLNSTAGPSFVDASAAMWCCKRKLSIKVSGPCNVLESVGNRAPFPGRPKFSAASFEHGWRGALRRRWPPL